MHGPDGRPGYQAYVLRCWQERSLDCSSASTWRFSVEDPHTSLRRGFATWQALLAFLQDELCIVEPRADVGAAEG
jgi:hypothetical protein